MYAAGLGFQVTDLNPFLKSYYKSLKGEEIQEALANTSGSIRTWEKLIKSFQEKSEGAFWTRRAERKEMQERLDKKAFERRLEQHELLEE